MTTEQTKPGQRRRRGQVPGSRRSGKTLRFRASVAEAQVIEAAAHAAGVSVAEFLIQAAMVAASGLTPDE